MTSTVSLVKCANYDPAGVDKAVRQSIALLGGMASFVRPGSRVLIKPNLLVAKEPECGVTTHPEAVRPVIRLLKEIDCRVLLGDSPSVWGEYIQDVSGVYEATGMKKLCQEEGVELVDFSRRRMRRKFPLTAWLDECDHLISVPKFKTHSLTILTGAIKNLFGLVSGTFKTELHKNYYRVEDFCPVLVDIFEEARPSLTVIDGIIAMEGEGPGSAGKLRQLGLVLAGSDCVALDSVLAKIMGLDPLDIPSTKEAAKRNLGVSELSKIILLGQKMEDISGRPFILPQASLLTRLKRNLPKPAAAFLRRFIRYYPYLISDRCIRCQACIKACPTKVISLKEKGIVFDYRSCIACFCCLESCPEAAIKIRRSFLAKAAGL